MPIPNHKEPKVTSDNDQTLSVKLLRIHYCSDGDIMGIFQRYSDFVVKFIYPSHNSLTKIVDSYEEACAELLE